MIPDDVKARWSILAILVSAFAILWQIAPSWVFLAVLGSWLIGSEVLWQLVDRFVPFEYQDLSLESLDGHLDEFYRRAFRRSELLITEQATGRVLRIRKDFRTWLISPDFEPLFLNFIPEALDPAEVDIKELTARCPDGSGCLIPTKAQAAQMRSPF